MNLYSRPDYLFTLRVWTTEGMITIHAFDANFQDPHTGHSRIDVVVKHRGKFIFERGTLWCGVNRWTTLDGIAARELVMSLVAMRPGDTDADFFEPYSPEQLAWVTKYSDVIGMVREERYCDENGNLKERAS